MCGLVSPWRAPRWCCWVEELPLVAGHFLSACLIDWLFDSCFGNWPLISFIMMRNSFFPPLCTLAVSELLDHCVASLSVFLCLCNLFFSFPLHPFMIFILFSFLLIHCLPLATTLTHAHTLSGFFFSPGRIKSYTVRCNDNSRGERTLCGVTPH